MRWKDVLEWRDDRVKLCQLNEQIRETREAYADGIQKAASPDARWQLYDELLTELEPYENEVEQIRTRGRLKAAHRLSVPIPDLPASNEDNDYWSGSMSRNHILTDKGHIILRKEIAAAQEIARKPIVEWGAVGISVLSLIVSIIALLK